jgi:[ribosomal protein S18]-alanine N-acetyltransferase
MLEHARAGLVAYGLDHGFGGERRRRYHRSVTIRMRVDGDWPAPITLRKGWARAESRPWNAVIPMAHLRLVRGGGAAFIKDCVDTLLGVGAAPVLSPPLPRSARQAWHDAEFEHYADLALMRRGLERIGPPDHLVHTGTEDDLDEALRIDTAAFSDFWQFDRTALAEAIDATPRSVLHVVRHSGGGLCGFAVTGVGNSVAYLQRVAVDPASQGRGIGRSLVRTSAMWARREGARAMMLNTPVENLPAIALYESEGFTRLDEPLALLVST